MIPAPNGTSRSLRYVVGVLFLTVAKIFILVASKTLKVKIPVSLKHVTFYVTTASKCRD